jgi:hypothetical protein
MPALMVAALMEATSLAATLGVAATFFCGNFGVAVTLVVIVEVEAAATLGAAATLVVVVLSTSIIIRK